MKKEGFSLSSTNLIYYGILSGLFLILFISSTNWSAESIGYAIGILLSYILLPSVIAFLVWLGAGKNKKSGHVAFNITLTIMILSKIASIGKAISI